MNKVSKIQFNLSKRIDDFYDKIKHIDELLIINLINLSSKVINK